MLNIIYHPQYLDYRFSADHPFWSERAEVFLAKMRKAKKQFKLITPEPGTDADLILVHDPAYLQKVKFLASQNGFLSPDTPLHPQVLQAAYYSVGGTLLAARLALKNRRVINLLGGLHHAGIYDSSGFCIFNDPAIAVRSLQINKLIKKAFIFDIDVHAGQGTQEIFYSDPSVFTLSVHQDPATIYPGTGFPQQKGEGRGKGFNQNIILSPGSGEKEFLPAVKQGLSLQKKFSPDLTLLILGADTYKKDRLGSLKLTLSSYIKIGSQFKSLKNLAILCAGGYSKEVPIIWQNFLKGIQY